MPEVSQAMNVPLVQRRGVLYLERRVRPTKFLGWCVADDMGVRISKFFKTRAEAEASPFYLLMNTMVMRKFRSKVKKAYDVAPVQWG